MLLADARVRTILMEDYAEPGGPSMLRKAPPSGLLAALCAALVITFATAALVAVLIRGGRDDGDATPDLMDQEFTAANGLTSRYHLFAADVPTDRPVGLLLQFHGDGAFEFENPASEYSLGGPSGIVTRAKQHDLLVMAVLSPDRQEEVTWWEEGSANADYVRDLVEEVAFTGHDIDRADIWLVGYSGGAQFVTQFLLPEHSGLIEGGGSVVFGGGGAPRVPPAPFAEPLKDAFPMRWYTGADDDGRNGTYNALRDAVRGSRWYAERGFETTLEVPAGVGHDDLPFGEVAGEAVAAARADRR